MNSVFLKIKQYSSIALIAAFLVVSIAGIITPPAMVSADAKGQVCNSIGGCDGGGADIQRVITQIVNILSAIGGIIAVIVIIVAGVKFITSGGDSSGVASARNTIIYAIVGLIIIAFAQIIVRFVLQNVTG